MIAPTDPQPPPDFLLVLPSYRESARLPRYLSALVESLATAPFTTEILVVDDGSPQAEQRAVLSATMPRRQGSCTLLPALLRPTNGRKGDAILDGWRSRRARWLAFADADGATAADEVRRVLGEVHDGDPDGRSAHFAVRATSGPLRVARSPARRIVSRAFSLLAALALRTAPMDFQCGFKIIPGPALAQVDHGLEGRGFCFDPALLLALRSARIPVRTVPIRWSDQPGGSVSAWRNGPAMLLGLLRLSFAGSSGPANPP